MLPDVVSSRSLADEACRALTDQGLDCRPVKGDFTADVSAGGQAVAPGQVFQQQVVGSPGARPGDVVAETAEVQVVYEADRWVNVYGCEPSDGLSAWSVAMQASGCPPTSTATVIGECHPSPGGGREPLYVLQPKPGQATGELAIARSSYYDNANAGALGPWQIEDEAAIDKPCWVLWGAGGNQATDLINTAGTYNSGGRFEYRVRVQEGVADSHPVWTWFG